MCVCARLNILIFLPATLKVPGQVDIPVQVCVCVIPWIGISLTPQAQGITFVCARYDANADAAAAAAATDDDESSAHGVSLP